MGTGSVISTYTTWLMGYELVGHTATPANFEAREPIRVHELPQTDQLLPDY